MSGNNDYVCGLNEASLKKAIDELNEDPKERHSSVETFRQWVLQQPHICCPTDTAWLLRYLRVAKFSQLVARQKLSGYLSCKSEFPKWYDDLDTLDPGIQAVIDSGVCVPLPGVDSEGRKILFGVEGALDTSNKVYDSHTVMRMFFALLHYLISNENVQVNGFIYLSDMTKFSIKHQTFWGMEVMKNSTRCFEGNFPSRFKGYYVYNEGPLFDALMAIVKPFMSKKSLSRTHLFGDNLEKMYKTVPKHMLPDEYLPDEYDGRSAGSLKSLVEKLKQELSSPEVRQQILADTKAEYGIDKKSAPTDIPQASFRKLNID